VSGINLSLRVELDDTEPYIVETRLRDHNLWDVTRAKHGWPKPDEAPMTWLGFLAWSASRRTGAIEATLSWEAFLAACIGVENVAADDEESERSADPTIPVLGVA
jgi:hypothetical protein